MATATRPLTMADLLAMPADGKRRWLIHGRLREEDATKRNRLTFTTMAHLTGEVYAWWRQRPAPHGNVVCGEAAVQLTDEGTGFGVDVAYVPPDVMIRQTDEHTIIHGVPAMIAEILSPSTSFDDLNEKIDAYLAGGVPLVWVIDTRRRTVTTYRPGEEPTLVNVRQTLADDSVLPGFSVPVANLFE